MFEKDADPKNLPIMAKAVISPFRSVHNGKSKFPKLSWGFCIETKGEHAKGDFGNVVETLFLPFSKDSKK